MTTIVWDGKVLAADKRSVYGGMINTVTKAWKVQDKNGAWLLIAGAGDYGQVEAMKAWIVGGADPGTFPEMQKSKDDYAAMLAVDAEGNASLYERTPYPVRYDRPPMCIGSGREYARAVLTLGFGAEAAVEVAGQCDTGTGNGVTVLLPGPPLPEDRP